MEDYEIRDVMGRSQYPVIDLEFEIESKKIFLIVPIIQKVELVIKAQNAGRIYARYVNCLIHLPSTLAAHKASFFGKDLREISGETYFTLVKNNTRRDELETANGSTLGTSWFDPVLPSLHHAWQWRLPRGFDELRLKGSDEKILWEVHADNAPKRIGSMSLREIKFITRNESLYTFVKAAIAESKAVFVPLLLLVSALALCSLYNVIRPH